MNNIEYKNLLVDKDIMTCYLEGEEVPLSKNEYNLLLHFLDNQNKILTRDELSETVWHKKQSGRTVDVTVSRLRKKLKDAGNYIKTKNGFGYGFVDK